MEPVPVTSRRHLRLTGGSGGAFEFALALTSFAAHLDMTAPTGCFVSVYHTHHLLIFSPKI